MMNNVMNRFISEVAHQLMPYLLQDNADNNDVDTSEYKELEYILESSGTPVLDLDEMVLEEEDLR